MKRTGHYLLIYDIAEDRTRYTIAKIAEGYGIRVQRSALECKLTRGMKERLWRELEGVVLGSGDGIRLYSVASGKMHHLGVSPLADPQDEAHHAVIL